MLKLSLVPLLLVFGVAEAGIQLGILEQEASSAQSPPTTSEQPPKERPPEGKESNAYGIIKSLILSHFDSKSCDEVITGSRQSLECEQDDISATLMSANGRIVKLGQCNIRGDDKCKEIKGIASLDDDQVIARAKRLFGKIDDFERIRAMVMDLFMPNKCKEDHYGMDNRYHDIECNQGQRWVFLGSRDGIVTGLGQCNVREAGVCHDVYEFTNDSYQNIKKAKRALGYINDYLRVKQMLEGIYGKENCEEIKKSNLKTLKCEDNQGKTATLKQRNQQLQSLEECDGTCRKVDLSVYRRENISAVKQFLGLAGQ